MLRVPIAVLRRGGHCLQAIRESQRGSAASRYSRQRQHPVFAPRSKFLQTSARPGGKPLCTLTLKNAPQASGDGNLDLAVAPGCDKTIAALKLDGWMIEGVKLVLHGAGDRSLAFIDDGNDGFDKAPDETGKPLVMQRKP